jgi:hypothetical protein
MEKISLLFLVTSNSDLSQNHEKINIKTPNKAVPQIITVVVTIPMTKVRAVESVAAKPANTLMPAARNIIGASNKKPIILHHTR